MNTQQPPVDVDIQPTPNPNALKFILSQDVKTEGKASYQSPKDCEHLPFAQKLFELRGVDQIHFFQNTITVSKFSFEPWDHLEPLIVKTIQDNIAIHDASYQELDPEIERRKNLSPELQQIENILDKRIRPGLQGDGGDLVCLSYENNVLIIKYEGACGTCPSSTMGTLEAIRGILQEEFNENIEIYTAPAH